MFYGCNEAQFRQKSTERAPGSSCRPWVLAAGVVMHFMIDIGIIIGIFSYAMFVLYLAWVPPAL
jgi:hypothetical protein